MIKSGIYDDSGKENKDSVQIRISVSDWGRFMYCLKRQYVLYRKTYGYAEDYFRVLYWDKKDRWNNDLPKIFENLLTRYVYDLHDADRYVFECKKNSVGLTRNEEEIYRVYLAHSYPSYEEYQESVQKELKKIQEECRNQYPSNVWTDLLRLGCSVNDTVCDAEPVSIEVSDIGCDLEESIQNAIVTELNARPQFKHECSLLNKQQVFTFGNVSPFIPFR